MKLFRFAIAAAAALTAIACTREQEDPIQDSPEEVQDGYKVLSIKASQADETKTAYASEVYFSWSAGDKISVLCNNGSANFWQTFTVTTPSTSSTFTATVTDEISIGAMDGTKVALYPASDSHIYNSSSDIRFHIPAERDFRAANGGHKESAIPMFAWGDANDNFAFANLTGAVKFSFSNIPSSTTQVKMVFENTCHLKLNGTYPLSLSSTVTNVEWSAEPSQTASENAVSYYADVENGVACFYLPYATGSLWAWNHLSLEDAANGTSLFSNTSIGQINVTKNTIVVLPTIDIFTGQTGLVSAYGIDWNAVAPSRNTNTQYPAIRTLKATADLDYLYVYLEVDPASLTKTHAYDHYIKVYAAGASGSNSYWSNSNSITKIGSSSWAVANGSIAYADFGSNPSDCNKLAKNGTWYYEIRMSRANNAAITNPGTVSIGAVIDDTYYDNSAYGHSQGDINIGVIPTKGSAMYNVTLPADTPALTGSVNINRNLTESNASIANPERGLYKMVEYKYHKRTYDEDDSSKDELETTDITLATTGVNDSYYQCYQDAGNTNRLVLTLFYIHDFVDSDHISSAGIAYIESVLTNIRNEGKKAIVRFGYNNRHPSKWHQEPTAAQIKNHLEDLNQTFSKFEDVIYVFQAGFIGTYGEWYYTTNFGPAAGGVDYTVSGNSVSNYTNRQTVLKALLDNVPESRQIDLRTPEYKACYVYPTSVSNYQTFTGFGTDADHRLGFHNDAFLYGNGGSTSSPYKGDMGTFHQDWQKNMWKDQGEYLINGGEAPYSSKPIEGMDGYTYANVIDAIYNYHYSYLHHDTGYHSNPSSTSPDDGSTLMRHWHVQGWMDDIEKWLGYRLFLSNVTVTGDDHNSGTTLNVSLTLKNSGAARVVNARPMELVLIHNNNATVLKNNVGDVRLVPCGTLSNTTVTPGSKTYTFTVTLPQNICSGDKLALWLPDNAAGLQSRPEYSIRLANDGIEWDNGYNVLHTF